MLDLIAKRRSCRRFKSDKLDKSLLEKIIAAGRQAASAHGTESTVTILLDSVEARALAKKSASSFMGIGDPFYGAPHVIAVLAEKNERLKCGAFDGALVLGNMILAATSLGVGSCWINTAQYDTMLEGKKSALLEITETIGLGRSWDGIGYLILGWPEDDGFFDAPRRAFKDGRVFVV